MLNLLFYVFYILFVQVRNRYSEQYDPDSITALLGMKNVEGVAAITAQQGFSFK